MKIEALEASGLSTSVLYAPENFPADSKIPFAETSLVGGMPDGKLVNQDSPFEIRVAGMMVKNFDKYNLRRAGSNELVMYSVQTDPKSSSENGDSLPFIHFDHRSDAYQSIERANTCIPIPASKAYVTGANGKLAQNAKVTEKQGSTDDEKKGQTRKSVNVRFKIIELDTPNETVKQAIAGIDVLGGVMSEFAMAAPTLGLLAPALTVAGSVSKHALDSYARPDKVFSVDMDFLLADRKRVKNGTAPNGEYLPYGYYFFLSEPMEATLYASVLTPNNVQLIFIFFIFFIYLKAFSITPKTAWECLFWDTAPSNVQLMLRRYDGDNHAPKNVMDEPVPARKFFPLTQVATSLSAYVNRCTLASGIATQFK